MSRMNCYSVYLICLIALLIVQVSAQAKVVKFRFEIEGKPVKVRPKVTLYAEAEKVELGVTDDHFVVPVHLEKTEKLNVRFTAGKYDLFFESVYLSKFEGEWIIGIDKKPFDLENTASAQPGKQIKQINYINFQPPQGDGTRMVVILYEP